LIHSGELGYIEEGALLQHYNRAENCLWEEVTREIMSWGKEKTQNNASTPDPTVENPDHSFFFYLPNYSRYLHASYAEAKGMVTA